MTAYPWVIDATGFVSQNYPGSVEMVILYENKEIQGRTSDITRLTAYKYENNTCYYNPSLQNISCAATTRWNLKDKESVPAEGLGIFNFGCVKVEYCPDRSCAYSNCLTSWVQSSFLSDIPVRAYSSTKPALPSVTVTPMNGALRIIWGAVTNVDVFCYKINLYDGTDPNTWTWVEGGYTESTLRDITIGNLTNGKTYTVVLAATSHSQVLGQIAEKTGVPVGATLPQVFSLFITPSSPTVGQSFTITTQIANTGPTGKVRAVFKVGGTTISTQDNPSLATFPGGGLWTPTPVEYTMPNNSITITVDAYGWDGSNWVFNHSGSINVSPGIPTCEGIELRPFVASIEEGGSVNFTASILPTTYAYVVEFRLIDDTVLGTVTSSGGTALFTWYTTGRPAGTYYVRAYVQGQTCYSIQSIIEIAPAARQWTLSIYVKDADTLAAIVGATVVAQGQTATTNPSGLATFLVDEGTVNISISKTGYNLYSKVESVYNNKTVTYYMTPVGPTTGSLRFISVPTGVDVYFGATLKGNTGIGGTLTISDLTPGPVNYTAKKTGYNDLSGTATVVAGATTDVPVSLTPETPTTGDVCMKSDPSGASITIDDTIQAGKTTAMSGGGCTSTNTITALTPGSHSYKLTKIGYEDKIGTFSITAGQTTTVDVSLVQLPTVGNANFTSSPSGARIYIDNVDTTYTTPATVQNITAGSHTYKLTLTGYQDATGQFDVTAGQTTMVPPITLVQRIGNLKFFSIPVAADISIGGVSKGVTIADGLLVSGLPIGPTNYVATLTGYDTYNSTVTVVENTITDVTIMLTPSIPNKGSLTIETTPPGARIFINEIDKLVNTPHTFTDMDVGGYTYQLTKSGYDTVFGTFSILPEQTTTITRTLQPSVSGAGGGAMIFGIIGLAALGMMMTAKPKASKTTKEGEIVGQKSAWIRAR